MRHTALIITILVLGATTASAGTFSPTPYLAEAQVDMLNKNVANQQFGRDLFGGPYATVVVGNVDVYDQFPYLEAHYFQIVSDPKWDRLLMGEVGSGLIAYDGRNEAFGRLASPRGLSTDEMGRVYVADTNNDRVLVFQTVSEFDRVELQPLFSIDGLSKPYDVAFSDGGTPFDESDDRLYIANTGRNEVRRYTLTDGKAQLTDALGQLGSGADHFAGPMALTVGHKDGVHCNDIFVSDAHNGRMVHLRDTGNALAWAGALQHDLGVVTSLDTDHWGNIYAAAPHVGKVAKYTSSLFPVASFNADIKRPRSFHVSFANVTDHRNGERSRAGQGNGVLVEEWSGDNGIRLLNLGVELVDAAVMDEDNAAVGMTLTDHAAVTAEITDIHTGQVIARHEAGVLDAGPQTIRFSEEDYVASWSEGEYRMTVTANSMYSGREASEVDMNFMMKTSGSPSFGNTFALLGNQPNPFNPTTTIRFTIPSGPASLFSLRVYDVAGRLVRTLAAGQTAQGLQEVAWDGRNDRGTTVGSGIYFYRVDFGAERLTGKMVLLK